MNKGGSYKGIFIVMLISLVIAFFWNQITFIKNAVSYVLNPTAGALMNWNLDIGMTLIVLIIAFFTTVLQKYATDQKTLKEIKKRQKELNKEMRAVRNSPDKMAELQKEMLPLSGQLFKLSMRPIIYTSIPLILFFRWFMDFFATTGNPHILGFFNWFWFYLLGSIVFSSILRKVMDVA